MIDLSTNYLGLKLRTPLVAAASPLSEKIENIRRLEDAGASAVVLYSLFEEQLRHDRLELEHHLSDGTDSFAEALTFYPSVNDFYLGPEEYLEHIRRAKQAVNIPIIASLNGASLGGWVDYARKMQQAGADALELNVYHIASDPLVAGADVEQTYLDILAAVKRATSIPVAIKLGPFFSNFAHMARRLDETGADALVLFNRFYQPDIDLETLELRGNILLSTPMAMRLPLRWIAILYGRIKAELAATSGVHRGSDAIKMVMSGASVTQLASALLAHGIDHLRDIETQMISWMEEHEYESVQQMRGSMSQLKCPDPSGFERAHYVKALNTYKAVGMSGIDELRLTEPSE